MAANRGDALHRVGRSREGLAAVISPRPTSPQARAPRAGWRCSRREIEFGAGGVGRRRGAPAAPWPARPARRSATSTSRRAGLLLGRGDTRAARPLLEEPARSLADVARAAVPGRLRRAARRARAAARATSTPPARSSRTRSTGSSSAARTASASPRSPAPACASRPTPPQRARDLGDAAAERRRRPRAEMLDARVQAAAEDLDLPVHGAHAASPAADARPRRGRGRPGALRRRRGRLGRARAPVPRRAGPLRRGRGAPARRATATPP